MRSITLPALTQEQHEELEGLYQKTRDVRMKTRAQMILLAVEKHLTATAPSTVGSQRYERAKGKGVQGHHPTLLLGLGCRFVVMISPPHGATGC